MKVKEVIEALQCYVNQEWKAKIWFDGKYYPIHAILPFENHPEEHFAIIWSGNVAEEMLNEVEK